jgi:hypothetical protein
MEENKKEEVEEVVRGEEEEEVEEEEKEEEEDKEEVEVEVEEEKEEDWHNTFQDVLIVEQHPMSAGLMHSTLSLTSNPTWSNLR